MTSDLKYWYLREHQLFRNLSYSEINYLCILKKFKKSKKGEILELPFSEEGRVFLLKKGILKLIKFSEQGDELVLDVLHKGEIFGELGFGAAKPDNEYFQVVSQEAIICTFHQNRLEDILHKKPDFAFSYIKFMGFKLKKMQNQYKNILFKDAKTRLLLLIISILEKEGINRQEPLVLPNYLTQKDIAQLICATRQTVITLFNQLEREGILIYSQKAIQILDIEQIKILAKM